MSINNTLPNFIVVGANKGGTTSLYHYLKQHPEVYLSPIKEPHYFSKDIDTSLFLKSFANNKLQDIEGYVNGEMDVEYHAAFVRSWEQYQLLFKNIQAQKAIGELSTSYLYSTVAAQEIKQALGDIKIIIALRNPIQRAFSHYRMNLYTGNSNIFNFMQAIQEDEKHIPKVWGNANLYLELGLYYEQVKRYLEIFSPENVKIIFTEDMRRNSKQLISELYAFIGVDPNFIADTSVQYNEVYTPKYKNLTWLLNTLGIRPLLKRISGSGIKKFAVKYLYRDKSDKGEITPEEKAFLINYYKVDIQKLSALLNKDLSNWMQ
ncbi:MAG: sulfotransferase domain-containing protein [Bacteroidetes bacterium]|nr:sulfotransferase domain-containing protein [Bacteroidota bacterium]MBP7398278.1 sulfotransferase domain-containing protein [Chitinophagales bacterium]MBK7108725.1 sulfotransferase domain-containing protein [Bacteroidota bacterium]MBK8488948.1 sulfotransferase domain-containing protein [Bacteroidota bacterium]MBK8680795.1 sulfotransferase domain-containing protein [Bacteroidota bacterium]